MAGLAACQRKGRLQPRWAEPHRSWHTVSRCAMGFFSLAVSCCGIRRLCTVVPRASRAVYRMAWVASGGRPPVLGPCHRAERGPLLAAAHSLLTAPLGSAMVVQPGQLARCSRASGDTTWLCRMHKRLSEPSLAPWLSFLPYCKRAGCCAVAQPCQATTPTQAGKWCPHSLAAAGEREHPC